MTIEFAGQIWFWKGPAPWFFLKVPSPQSDELHEIMTQVTYGWGMIPVKAQIGKTIWTTSLWPKDGTYVLPIKASIRKTEKLEEGDFTNAKIEVIDSNLKV